MTIVALTLSGALLACIFSTPVVVPNTPTPSFSTATPGGSVSVSLLTPPTPAPGAGATLIGPVADATNAHLTAVAATQTAAIPTPTVPGVFTDPARCPQLGSPTLPTQPPVFTEYAELIVQFLSAGGPTTILEATLRTWGAVSDSLGGLVRADRDFTGDGVPEVLIVAFDPQHIETTPRPGDLFIFGCEEGAYRLLHQAGYALDRGVPTIRSADDINSDYLNDLVYTTETCGAHTCYVDVHIYEWSLTLGNFESLTTEGITEPYADVRVVDVDEDGLGEIVIHTGMIASVGAGPQRTYTKIWKWDGTLYTIAEVTASEIEYRIHQIYEADDALLAGDYKEAVSLYKEAIENENLKSWEYPNEADYLKAFSRYRIMLAYAAEGRVDKAQEAYEALMWQYAPPTPTPVPEGEEPGPTPTPFFGPGPGAEFWEMARFFWQDFTVNRNIALACQIVIGYTQANPALFAVLNSFGYANRQYTAYDLCPFVN